MTKYKVGRGAPEDLRVEREEQLIRLIEEALDDSAAIYYSADEIKEKRGKNL